MSSKSILVISDLHIPYQHKDAIDFLAEVKKKYKPDQVVCIGDEVDYHSLSFHPSDQDLFSAGHELEEAKYHLSKLYKLFPKVDLVDSNHGSMVYRKQKFHGMPRNIFKTYNEILDAPNGWQWHPDLVVTASNKQRIYFHHGKTGRVLGLAQSVGMNAVCGHFHEQFSINYWGTPKGLKFQMVTGCLIDNESLAFSYNKNFTKVPIIGCGVIIEGVPKLVPMIRDKKNRWIGKII